MLSPYLEQVGITADDLILKPSELKETRRGFGDALYVLGKQDVRIVALSADLAESVRMDKFYTAFPDRFFQCGIAEANMVGVAAGLATAGFIPYAGSFANFITGRVFDQIRQSVCYSRKNVKLIGSHAGLTLGEDGASHQILEDIALMRSLPFMIVINPCDYWQTYKATFAIAEHYGPAYLRFGRPKWPVFLSQDTEFEIGKALVLKEGKDVTIFATGHLVWISIQAEAVLRREGIDVELINIHTIKPLDEEAILESALKTRAVVTCEEHQINGGMGEAIASLLTRKDVHVPVEMVAVKDRFGQSGKPLELLHEYELDVPHVVEAVKKVLVRKERLGNS